MAPIYPNVTCTPFKIERYEPKNGEEGPWLLSSVPPKAQFDFHTVNCVDPKSFQEKFIDPTWFTSFISKGSLNGLLRKKKTKKGERTSPKGGSVHKSEHVVISRPILCDEELFIKPTGGTLVETHRLGTLTTNSFEIYDSNNVKVAHVNREGVNITNEASTSSSSNDTANRKKKRARTNPKHNKAFISRKQLTPMMCVNFCQDFTGTNPIHHDPEKATQAGYKAPIWAGTQGLNIIFEHIFQIASATNSTIDSIEYIVEFKRPAHWSDGLELWFGQKKSEIAGIGDYSLVNNEGKACLEMSVKSMTFANICNFARNKL